MKKRYVQTNEFELMRNIVDAIKSRGYFITRTNVGKVKKIDGSWFDTGLEKGHPDLYGRDHEGRIFYIEVKWLNGKPSPEQVAFLEAARADNCKAGIARSIKDAIDIVEGK